MESSATHILKPEILQGCMCYNYEIVCRPQESCPRHKHSFKKVCLHYMYSLTANNCPWEDKYKFIIVKITNKTVIL